MPKKPRQETRDGKTGYGDPGSKFFGQVLSAEEEKRMGQDDQMVAAGKLWSEASTGVYLTVGVADRHKIAWDRPCICAATEHLGDKLAMWVMSTDGKPKLMEGGFYGASLEIPSDLGDDLIKRQYVTEWISETMMEAWGLSGLTLDGGDPAERGNLFQWVASAVERACREAGL